MNYTFEYFNASVRAALDDWPDGIQANYNGITKRMKHLGPNLGMPHTRAMGDGLFEIRAQGREGIGRALFCTLVGQRIVVLHSFIKKTQETPLHDLNIARQRLKEIKHG
jgi:phage-related protein